MQNESAAVRGEFDDKRLRHTTDPRLNNIAIRLLLCKTSEN